MYLSNRKLTEFCQLRKRMKEMTEVGVRNSEFVILDNFLSTFSHFGARFLVVVVQYTPPNAVLPKSAGTSNLHLYKLAMHSYIFLLYKTHPLFLPGIFQQNSWNTNGIPSLLRKKDPNEDNLWVQFSKAYSTTLRYYAMYILILYLFPC